MNWPWEELGLPGPVELPMIRRAYAERLKETRPEENPEGFQRLHSAYQAACRLARQGAAFVDEPPEEAGSAGAVSEELPVEVEREWDFARLFAEGEAEERGRRFQKLRELRQINQLRYAAWEPKPPTEPAEVALSWVAVSRTVALLEELALSGAEIVLWKAFCKSELFLYIRDNPDFVFALEDFLQEFPEVPQAACGVLFHAYGFDTRPVKPEYQPLYRILTGHMEQEQETPEEHRKQFPTADEARKTPTVNFPTGKLRIVIFLLLCAGLLANLCADYLVEEETRKEQVLVWMGEDFGNGFSSVTKWDWREPFLLLDVGTQTYFRARWDGPRNMEQGKRGYVTNYTEMRMSQALAAFANQWHCTVLPRYEAGNPDAADVDWTQYYVNIALTGAGESITALGDLLSDIREEAWYQKLPPEYVLYLGWHDWRFYSYDAPEGAFDGPALREYYETFFGPDLCAIVLRQTGIAVSDIGETFLLFTESGTVKLENRDFFHVVGTNQPPDRAIYHYFLSVDATELFCVPAGRKISELTLRELYGMNQTEYDVKGFPEKLSVFTRRS